MNLFEMLDTYKTNPVSEIKKIQAILNREAYVSYHLYSLRDVFDDAYSNTGFASHEPSFNDFLDNIILKDYDENNYLNSIKNYRYLCEFLMALIDDGVGYAFQNAFGEDLAQLEKIILSGLKRCGYTIEPYGKYRVTKKIDEEAESIAATNGIYGKNILDYLLAKTIDEKEKALTSFANQLEAIKSKDTYIKETREYVQLPRHKDENINNPKYSWFYDKQNYEENMDKLFRIFLSIVSYNDCQKYLEEFKQKKGD